MVKLKVSPYILALGFVVAPFSPWASAKKLDSKKELNTLTRSFEELKDSKLVEMKVEKSFSSPFVLKPKTSQGNLYFSKGKIRLSFTKPKTSLMVLSGENIWLEEHHPAQGKDRIQVTHFKAEKAKKSSALLAVLFGESKIWKELEVLNKKTEDGVSYYDLKPKDQKRLEVKDLRIGLSVDLNQIHSISFADELENKTSYQFSQVKFVDSFKPSLFKYSPPKEAEVTRF